MPVRRVLSQVRLARRLAALAGARHVPLLVIRLCELERVAWRDGRRAARRLERHARDALAAVAAARLRAGDLLAYDRCSATFSIALVARGKEAIPLPNDCRATLGRTTEAFARVLPLEVESGWTLVGEPSSENLVAAWRSALARGARERQRFDFFGTVAHEMRTPLTAIRGYLQTLLDEPHEDSTARRFLEIARDETLRLGRLVDGMFAVSLLDLGFARAPSAAESTRTQAALDAALGALGPRIHDRQASLRVHALSDVAVSIEHDHLVQVFANVIGNALEHAGQHPRIAISAVHRERHVEIAIDDDGPGIPQSERDAVFTLGYRRDSAGTGLGLAVVRELLERAGGSAGVGESPLGGARIVIALAKG